MLCSSSSDGPSLFFFGVGCSGVINTRLSTARWQQHLKRPELLPISAWPRYSRRYLTLTFMTCREKKGGWCAKLARYSFLPSLSASIRRPSITLSISPRSNCYISLSIIPSSSTPILSFPFFFSPLSSPSPPPAARKHPSLQWVIYDGALIIHGHESRRLVLELRGSFITT